MLSGLFDSSFNHRVALVNLSQRIQHFWQFGGVDWLTCNLHHRNRIVFEWAKEAVFDSRFFSKFYLKISASSQSSVRPTIVAVLVIGSSMPSIKTMLPAVTRSTSTVYRA